MADILPVLTFHRLAEDGAVISYPPRSFRRAMARLHDAGCRTLSLLEISDHLRKGMPLPERSFGITFDDGYRSVYDEAFPVLRHFGMSATVFLTVGEGGRPGPDGRLPSLDEQAMLAWREIREMAGQGIAFGAHTLTHPDLTRLPPDRIEAEVYGSKAIIEDALGMPVHCFAYPFGRYDRHAREAAARHFACACSDRLGLVSHRSDPYSLERVDGYYLRSNAQLRLLLTEWFVPYIRARGLLQRIRRAVWWRPG